MTGPGTNTYLVGNAEIAVIDPGPSIAGHIENILLKSKGCVRWILATHTHPDHSPGVAALAGKTGAEILGMPAPDGAHQDKTFSPTRVLADGDVLETDEFRLQAVHTPGHASNHLCYRHTALNWLFTGDHVIDGSTVVIDPPDGNMKHYIESLNKCKDLDCDALAPGHGDVIDDPIRVIDWIIGHRLEREARVLDAVERNPGLTTGELVPLVYKDVDPKLYGWAERSLLAHILKLEADELVERAGECWKRLI
ncbi:MAG: MBL fold metallo-hydrolase [Woeseiaceae bacterium]|nr:MBL fold metallo-hydrolase [Woeseiaceae bacterium]NIP21747.1 MBL fold metallo-hydrolase [Woeseiaceae bacterium]NIS90832.1 MBL fold metallo-hydrolase [Woeseiaceae bacterium]